MQSDVSKFYTYFWNMVRSIKKQKTYARTSFFCIEGFEDLRHPKLEKGIGLYQLKINYNQSIKLMLFIRIQTF